MKILRGIAFIILAASIVFTMIAAVASALAIMLGLGIVFTIVWGIAKLTGTDAALVRAYEKALDA